MLMHTYHEWLKAVKYRMTGKYTVWFIVW